MMMLAMSGDCTEGYCNCLCVCVTGCARGSQVYRSSVNYDTICVTTYTTREGIALTSLRFIW